MSNLQLVKCSFDRVDHFWPGFASLFPAPRSRKFNAGKTAEIGESEIGEMVQAFHDRFVKERAVMGATEQWANILHSFSSLYYLQYLWLTYPQRWFYGNCVRAISQDRRT